MIGPPARRCEPDQPRTRVRRAARIEPHFGELPHIVQAEHSVNAEEGRPSAGAEQEVR